VAIYKGYKVSGRSKKAKKEHLKKVTFRTFLGALSFTTARRGATRDMRVLTNRAVYSKLY